MDVVVPGDAGYDRVRPLSYSDADLIIICFSINSPESMENVVSKVRAVPQCVIVMSLLCSVLSTKASVCILLSASLSACLSVCVCVCVCVCARARTLACDVCFVTRYHFIVLVNCYITEKSLSGVAVVVACFAELNFLFKD